MSRSVSSTQPSTPARTVASGVVVRAATIRRSNPSMACNRTGGS